LRRVCRYQVGQPVLVDAGLVVGIVGVMVGAIGLALAFRERGKRRELDAEQRRPEIVVKMAARGRESDGLKRIQASVAVTTSWMTFSTAASAPREPSVPRTIALATAMPVVT
jgi:hypothetical protein